MRSNPSPASPRVPASLRHHPVIGRGIQHHLGRHLRLADEAMGPWSIPEAMRVLADQLDCTLAARDEANLSEFQDGILKVRPSLRVFALSLTREPDQADDLVQDAVLRALRKRSLFQPGTNLKAWLFTILRNSFYSEHRKRVHEVSDSDGRYAAQLAVVPEQMGRRKQYDLSSPAGNPSEPMNDHFESA